MSELRYSLEHEITFVLPATAFDKVYQSIEPTTGPLIVGQRIYTLSRRNHIVAIHLFAKSDNPKLTKLRLQFRFDQSQIRVRFSPKIIVKNQVLEGRWDKDMEIGRAFPYINGFGPIIASLIKEKFKRSYTSRERKLRISLDKVIGFNPAVIEQHGLPFYHLEIESNDPKALEEFQNCDYFHNYISPWVRCIEYRDTKWLQASFHSNGKFCLEFDTKDGLFDYLMSVKQTLLPGMSDEVES